jgi:hypothetical protein
MLGREAMRCWRILFALALSSLPAKALELRSEQHEMGLSLLVREVAEANRSSTHERTLTRVRLTPRSRPLSWLRFAGSLVVAQGGPTMHARADGFYRWREVFQNRSPSFDLEEAYVDLAWEQLDLRLGKQRIAWGKLDRFSPTDVANAFSYLDPFLVEENERRIGAPGALLSVALPASSRIEEARVSLLWLPLYLPFRFPDARCGVNAAEEPSCTVERWFPPAALPPSVFSIPAGLFPLPNGALSPALAVPLSFQVRNVMPTATARHGSFGARVGGRLFDFDTALYYFHGFDNQPAFRLLAWATGEPDPDPSNPFRVRRLTGHTVLEPEYTTIDLLGWDLSRSFSSVTFRAEAAYVFGRPFSRDLRTLVANPVTLRPQLLGALGALAKGAGAVPLELPASTVARDAVEWGAGVDVLLGGWLFLVQVNQTDVLGNDTPLLIDNVETRALASLKKSFLNSRLQLYLLAGQGFGSGYSYARPRLQYRWTDWLATEFGYLWIGGSRHSPIGQYRRNDQAWVSMLVDF